MPKLWLIFGLAYILVAILILLDSFVRLDAVWRWGEALHHESFFMATSWAAAVYLFVVFVEYMKSRRCSKSGSAGRKKEDSEH
ncbi:hypothetical protein ACFLX7_04070 [Chloroflexota bacterium]